MFDHEKMLAAACAAYGECIGMEGCLKVVADYMRDAFDLDDADAEYYARLAFKEWMEAYE